jgi:hypothetical protein
LLSWRGDVLLEVLLVSVEESSMLMAWLEQPQGSKARIISCLSLSLPAMKGSFMNVIA